MNFFRLSRYYTTTDFEESLCIADSMPMLKKQTGEVVFEDDYAADVELMMERVRKGYYTLYEGLEGLPPPIDIWRQFLLFSDEFLEIFSTHFAGQFDSFPVKIVSDAGDARIDHLVIPNASIDCLVELFEVMDEGDSKRMHPEIIDFADDNTPNFEYGTNLGYLIDADKCKGLDIFTISNAPTRFTVVSERFINVLYDLIPRQGYVETRNLRNLEPNEIRTATAGLA